MFTNMCIEPTILDGVCLCEIIDVSKLKKLINSKLLKETFHNPYVKYANERIQLQKYSNKIRNGVAKVKYLRSQKFNIGRVNPEKALGLHSIRREIRHTLAKDNFMDIDIVNAHPVILNQICIKNNIECYNLSYYVKKRDELRQEIMDFHNVDKESAKKLIIKIINLGSYKTWLEEVECNKEMKYLLDLTKELKDICDKLIKLNPVIWNTVRNNKKDGNIKSSFMAMYLQNIENKILEVLYLYCKEKRYVDNVCVLSNDGIMIPKENYNEKILDEFKDVVKDKLNLKLKFINKPYDQGYSDEEINKNQLDNTRNEFFEEILPLASHQFFAELFYSLNNDEYIFSKKLGWFRYDKYNKLVKCDGYPIELDNNVPNVIRAYLKEKFDEIDPNSSMFIKYSKIYQSYYKMLGGTGYCEAIIKKLRYYYNKDNIEQLIDTNYDLLAFENKVYDLSIKDFRNIEKDDYINYHIHFKAPTEDDYDKNVEKDIYDFLYSIQKGESNTKFLLKIIGNSLFGNKYEKIYLLTGTGGNGKGVLTSLMEKTCGDYFYTTSSQLLTSRFKGSAPNSSLYNCKNRRIVMVNEPEENDGDKELRFNLEFVKKITSNDTIETRDLNKSAEKFCANWVTFIQCNEKPTLDKIDDAVRRRFLLKSFPYNFVDSPKKDHEKKINRSLKNKFNNVIYHKHFIKILLDNINLSDTFEIPKDIIKETQAYLDSNDTIKSFIDDHLIITGKKNDIINSKELYDIFKSYNDGAFINKNKFKSALENKGIKNGRNKNTRGYIGVVLKEQDEIEENEEL